ncbi:MAG TPA: phosphate ABC transporter substrate-binding protein [Cytophagales bacterium]|nr:phosphate ABC transporter substrate-binding protein [Cytophagales bacterium]HAA18656.1 phosphate ABC transporter substrate-binding protein [Cytophagales bacterium]HAP62257.1 phosphate ABC transporter substrate-binding protein [Cytophagales bacterium]
MRTTIHHRRLRKAFGLNEYDFPDLPVKMSNVQHSRLLYGNRMGCSFCFPHGWETVNATVIKNRRSWKHHRDTQWKTRSS